jgi:ethanolamine ammonia-lyase small subunit
MTDNPDRPLAASGLPEIVRKVRARTPARLFVGRAGAAYRTNTQLELREAHAAAQDAVHAELDLQSSFGAEFVERWQLFEVRTNASGKHEYLLRPDLGRRFDDASRAEIQKCCPPETDLQIAIGDGLSVPAVTAQVPPLLPLLYAGANARGWKLGRSFVIHRCRVGILNEIGALLNPSVAVLLIGERPGLGTVESLSAYMGYRPRTTHSDANRNLVSNIHARGLSVNEAATRILDLAGQMMKSNTSGYMLRQERPALGQERWKG